MQCFRKELFIPTIKSFLLINMISLAFLKTPFLKTIERHTFRCCDNIGKCLGHAYGRTHC